MQNKFLLFVLDLFIYLLSLENDASNVISVPSLGRKESLPRLSVPQKGERDITRC